VQDLDSLRFLIGEGVCGLADGYSPAGFLLHGDG
jgi:hypothetical protein